MKPHLARMLDTLVQLAIAHGSTVSRVIPARRVLVEKRNRADDARDPPSFGDAFGTSHGPYISVVSLLPALKSFSQRFNQRLACRLYGTALGPSD